MYFLISSPQSPNEVWVIFIPMVQMSKQVHRTLFSVSVRGKRCKSWDWLSVSSSACNWYCRLAHEAGTVAPFLCAGTSRFYLFFVLRMENFWVWRGRWGQEACPGWCGYHHDCGHIIARSRALDSKLHVSCKTAARGLMLSPHMPPYVYQLGTSDKPQGLKLLPDKCPIQ